MKLIQILALKDNYIWILTNNKQCIIVDPSESDPILKIIHSNNLYPIGILLTHHHNDHINGVKNLLKNFIKLPVFGPKETFNKGTTIEVNEANKILINEFNFEVISLPGHTLGHVGFYQAPYLFCGDTLFSGGCGKVFEGTYEQLFNSIQKIAAFPDNTLICCAHEYRLSNLKFANFIWPENKKIKKFLKKTVETNTNNKKNIPTTLKIEKKINVFLQCHNIDLYKKFCNNTKKFSLIKVFTLLRKLKDQYQNL
ncbi:Hydroxyacylglutathione hydrolase [Candidatus Providencia siddallii]|uniref:Hydroxyacylglutathione hydrolase n=1 Tax=Candidatus Providencia siddallii TaxID=1715285 RepID=A0A0M6W718_9GAMM|nr:Hydroxyacylglutathione hydrolase [Candidatus Providencia siddallii]